MKIAIVNLKNKQVVSSYISNKLEQQTGRFGGPWDDPSQFEHVKIPSSLESELLSNLEAHDGEEQDGVQLVQTGTELSFDSQRRPIIGPNGEQISVPPNFPQLARNFKKSSHF